MVELPLDLIAYSYSEIRDKEFLRIEQATRYSSNFNANAVPQLFLRRMAESLSYWTVGSLLFCLLLILPTIMGLFGGNKFNVLGKVGSRCANAWPADADVLNRLSFSPELRRAWARV